MVKSLRFKGDMSSRFSHTSGLTKLIIFIEFFLVSYLLYSLTKSVYNSYQIDTYIDDFEAENETLEGENQQKTEDYLYFTSREYIDKIAKQNLGLVNQGEEVIILSPDILNVNNGNDEMEDGGFAVYGGQSIPEQWWGLFFSD
jgi:cell division protein FtsB